MAIDKSGDFWTSPDAGDIEPFLKDLAKEDGSIPINRFHLARCACGSIAFRLRGDDEEGCAERVCVDCQSVRFICDSADYWNEAVPERLVCHACDNDTFNVGVGLSLEKGKGPDIQWVTIGQRCATCGVLGSFADWKISYSPSGHLIDQV